MRHIKCILGFHKFELKKVDDQFMPKMRVMVGKCTRKECIEMELFFLDYKDKKIFGGHGDALVSFPMTKEDELTATQEAK